MLASAAPLARPQAPSASVVVITDVDGILRHADFRTLAEARRMLDALAGSTLVLCSNRGAEELRAIQRELGIRQPFISDGGAAVHIPAGYFCFGTAPDEGYETIDFGARRLGHALRLVIALFRTSPVPPLVVGIGFEWRDRVLLREVDVPVVIRDACVDQTALLRNVPQAYVTSACGDDGVLEAVFGNGSVGRA
jgi:predicted mannosyl-3-phosphoglycerate phosphatase (HAD superfamily)